MKENREKREKRNTEKERNEADIIKAKRPKRNGKTEERN